MIINAVNRAIYNQVAKVQAKAIVISFVLIGGASFSLDAMANSTASGVASMKETPIADAVKIARAAAITFDHAMQVMNKKVMTTELQKAFRLVDEQENNIGNDSQSNDQDNQSSADNSDTGNTDGLDSNPVGTLTDIHIDLGISDAIYRQVVDQTDEMAQAVPM